MIVNRKLFEINRNLFHDLFCKVFHREIELSYFNWRFLDNPLQEILMSFEMDGEKLIGNYSASPCIVAYNGKQCKSALSITTMTDADYTGRGIFAKLAKELYEQLKLKDYEFVWGFPNNNIHLARKKKLDWFDIYEIPTMVLDLKKLRQGTTTTNRIVSRDDSFDLDYSFTQNYPDFLYVKKDKSYLKWRYLSCPLNNYENYIILDKEMVSSYCVIKVYDESSIDIVDLQPADEISVYSLLQAIIEKANQKQIQKINTWAPINFFSRNVFERLGFINDSPITYFGAKSLQINGADLPLYDYTHWYIQMGDSDVY